MLALRCAAMADPSPPSPSSYTIRPAATADAAAMVEIYRPFIEQSSVSFEVSVPTVVEFAERVVSAQAEHAWLVAERAGEVLGYAYGTKHRAREAYRFTTEVSAYVAEGSRGQGIARALYEELFRRLVELGYCNALAGVTLPNDPSVAFHERLGFAKVGVYHRTGYKFGEWRDVAWFERSLREGPPGEDRGS